MTNGFWPKDSEDWAWLQGAASVVAAELIAILTIWVML